MSYLSPWLGPARRTRGAGGALGDSIVAIPDPVAALAAQVNRFGADAPAAYQFAQAPFLDSGNLSPGLALTALTIYQRRAADAYAKFHDAGSQALLDQANQGFASPTTFVMLHLADVTQAIRGFADSVGLAPAPSSAESPMTSIASLLSDPIAPVVLASAALGIYWLARR